MATTSYVNAVDISGGTGKTMTAPIFQSSVDLLSTLLEEGARASDRSVARFIEPMQGTLRRAQSKRHHLVFGRRGSGKSSLLYKSAKTLAEQGFAVAYVDLEPFKGHHYPDVLISVLLASLEKFLLWLEKYQPPKDKRLWYMPWKYAKGSQKHKLKGALLDKITQEIAELRQQLHLADNSQLSERVERARRTTDSASLKSGISLECGGSSGLPSTDASIESELASEMEASRAEETREEFKRSKIDYLHRKILYYHHIFSTLAQLTASDCFLFLDDLYHLVRSDHPTLLDYFHRIAKGHCLWLKVGTIKHRSTWYTHSPQPMGLKIGDDADDINLDLTLEKFSTSRLFLSQVLDSYIKEAGAPPRADILSDGGLDRLVISSGGVTRDFLGIFRRSIDEARERLQKNPKHARGDKISAEDVNMATGVYGDTKREEFQKDTLEDQQRLDEAFQKLRRFCLEKNKANIFLIDQDVTNEDSDLVQELIDLRLVHHVKSRVTVSARPGRVYRALLLDVSQYTGERKRRDIEMIEFWKEDREVLRKASFIYDPSASMEDLDQAIETQQPRTQSQTTIQGTQEELPFEGDHGTTVDTQNRD